MTIDITAPVTPNFTQAGPYCAGTSIPNLPLTSNNSISGSWSPAINNTTTATYTFTPSAGQCATTATMILDIVEVPEPNFSVLPYSPCIPANIQLYNASSVSGNCEWTLSNGDTYSGCNGPEIILSEPGCYDVTLQIDAEGCIGTSFIENAICVNSSPIADFDMNSQTISELESTVQFLNNSTPTDSNYWLFGDGNFSNEENPSHTYENFSTDSYEICLIVSQDNCTDTSCQILTIKDDLVYFVPNTFTPDNDEYNNEFKPIFTSGYSPYDYVLYIFNRWGEIIFESHNPEYGWNGSYGINENFPCQDGVYTWKIEFKLLENDERMILKGHVNLLR
jgi:gliding motility-associated-like protein